MSPMIEGGCFCRNIRYQIQPGAYLSVNCHCTMCRHVHGAPFVTWIVVPAEHFEHVGEQPRQLTSSSSGSRYFCPDCGTHVACVNRSHPDIIDVAVGSLDKPESFPPTMEIFGESRLGWATAAVEAGSSSGTGPDSKGSGA